MYDENIMILALNVSKLSSDPTAKVGCIITNSDNEILSVGYNKIKQYILIEDINYINANKEIKKYAFVHAEMMALSRLKDTKEELSIYITYPSCINCAVEYLLNSNYNFKNVFYIDKGSDSFKQRYNIKEALELMDYKNVNTHAIMEEELYNVRK